MMRYISFSSLSCILFLIWENCFHLEKLTGFFSNMKQFIPQDFFIPWETDIGEVKGYWMGRKLPLFFMGFGDLRNKY